MKTRHMFELLLDRVVDTAKAQVVSELRETYQSNSAAIHARSEERAVRINDLVVRIDELTDKINDTAQRLSVANPDRVVRHLPPV